MRSLVTALVLVASLTKIVFGQTASNCELRKDEDGVQVYVCEVDQSKFKAIRTVLQVNATIQQVIDMILDIADYNNWQYHTVNAHVLDRKSDTELMYYTEINSPWPASNRDLVVAMKIDYNAATKDLLVFTHSVPDYIPEKEGIVRVPMSQSKWRVKPINESTLSVEFDMLIDPGGTVPAWLVNLVLAEAPLESFRNFKNKIEAK